MEHSSPNWYKANLSSPLIHMKFESHYHTVSFWDIRRWEPSLNPTRSEDKGCWQYWPEQSMKCHQRPSWLSLLQPFLPGSHHSHSRGECHEVAFMFHKQKANFPARGNPTSQNVSSNWSSEYFPPYFFLPTGKTKESLLLRLKTFLGPCPSSTLFFFSFLSAPHPHPAFLASHLG